nr:MAG TPA: hypothetical protein [Caudoviricetes sp.]
MILLFKFVYLFIVFLKYLFILYLHLYRLNAIILYIKE